MMQKDVEHVLTILEIIAEALEGDGSTAFMPDVTPDQAARYIYGALNAKGYEIEGKYR
jgi:hypothetical protein